MGCRMGSVHGCTMGVRGGDCVFQRGWQVGCWSVMCEKRCVGWYMGTRVSLMREVEKGCREV